MGDRIVLGYDGLPRTAKAVEYALDAAQQQAVALSVMTATPQWVDLPNVVGMLRRDLASVLDRLKKRAQGRGIDLDVHLVAGFPAVELAKYAEEKHASLIVLGSRRQNFWRRWIAGSTSERVARLAHCAVVVVS